MTKRSDDDFGVVDASELTDADWVEINKQKRALDEGGDKALLKAWQELIKEDPVRASRIMGAFFPERMREALKDAMAENGVTEEDLR
jgi:hypothetical protein